MSHAVAKFRAGRCHSKACRLCVMLSQATKQPTAPRNQRTPPTKPLDLVYIAGEALRPPPRPSRFFLKQTKATKQPRKAYYLGMAPSSSKFDPRTDMTSRARYISTNFYRTPESIPQGERIVVLQNELNHVFQNELKRKSSMCPNMSRIVCTEMSLLPVRGVSFNAIWGLCWCNFRFGKVVVA